MKRAFHDLPEAEPKKDRFQVPPLLIQEGKRRTIIQNFSRVCDILNRDAKHVSKYMTEELGVPANLDGPRLILRSAISRDTLDRILDTYVKDYVICKACYRPDTHLLKESRVEYLKCDACGAKNSVRER